MDAQRLCEVEQGHTRSKAIDLPFLNAPQKKAGRDEHLTLLGRAGNNLASQAALTCRTYQNVFAAELEKQGVGWLPTARLVRWFWAALCGHSCVPVLLVSPDRNTRKRRRSCEQSNFQRKLVWIMKQQTSEKSTRL